MKRWQKCLAARLIGLVAVLDTCSNATSTPSTKRSSLFFVTQYPSWKLQSEGVTRVKPDAPKRLFCCLLPPIPIKTPPLLHSQASRSKWEVQRSHYNPPRERNVAQLRSMASPSFPRPASWSVLAPGTWPLTNLCWPKTVQTIQPIALTRCNTKGTKGPKVPVKASAKGTYGHRRGHHSHASWCCQIPSRLRRAFEISEPQDVRVKSLCRFPTPWKTKPSWGTLLWLDIAEVMGMASTKCWDLAKMGMAGHSGKRTLTASTLLLEFQASHANCTWTRPCNCWRTTLPDTNGKLHLTRFVKSLFLTHFIAISHQLTCFLVATRRVEEISGSSTLLQPSPWSQGSGLCSSSNLRSRILFELCLFRNWNTDSSGNVNYTTLTRLFLQF